MTSHRYVGLKAAVSFPTDAPDGWACLVDADLEGHASPAAAARLALLRGNPSRMRAAMEDIRGEGQWFADAQRAAAGWLGWLTGDAQQITSAVQSLRRSPVTGFRLDATLLESLHLLDSDASAALQLARRASGQARAASLPHWEFMAGLVLSRARRYAQQPLFASTILRALKKWMPPAYDAWRSWETLLAAGASMRRVHERIDALAPEWSEHTPFADDAEAVRTLRTPSDTAYARGLSHAAPRGLDGLAGPHGALVIGGVGDARRVWPQDTPEVDHDASSLRKKRIASLVCTLALESPLAIAQVFERTYGLTYRPGRHKRTFRVLLHRTRKSLEDVHMEIGEENEQLQLSPGGTFAAYDPRTVPFEDAPMISLLQTRSRLTTKGVMQLLNVPRRTAQDSLRRLVEQGILRRVLNNGISEYVCEDTVYEDPTQASRQARPPSPGPV